MNQAMLNSIMIALFACVLGIITTWFWKSRDAAVQKANKLADEQVKTMGRITELEQKLALVNQAVIPISTAFQAILIKELTHFHTPEMDALLVKIGPPNTLTLDEAKRLEVMLRERTRDMGPEISESERDAATILPAIMKRARAEADVIEAAETLKLKLVSVATVLGIPNTDEDPAVSEVLKMKMVSVAQILGTPEPTPSVIGAKEAASTLKKIEENTAATAESLGALNQRAVNRVATTTAKKAKNAEKE